MSADFFLLVLCGLLTACGTYLLLERYLIRMLLGLMLIGNGINLLLLAVGGPPGNPPIIASVIGERTRTADTLSQAMIITSIVITAAMAAFVLALAYRSNLLLRADEVTDDKEDVTLATRRADDPSASPNFDRFNDPTTGELTEWDDLVDYEPVEQDRS